MESTLDTLKLRDMMTVPELPAPRCIAQTTPTAAEGRDALDEQPRTVSHDGLPRLRADRQKQQLEQQHGFPLKPKDEK